MDIKEKVASVFSEVLNVNESIITPDLSIGDIPEWDSMGNLAVIARLESEFGIDFPMDELMNLTSVQEIIDRIERLKNETAA